MTKNYNISASPSYKNKNKITCVNGKEKPNKKYYSERYQAIENVINKNFDVTVANNENVIPSYSITKAQKTFNSKPNMGGKKDTSDMPKPKSLYFVYFKLNDSFYDVLYNIDSFTNEFNTKYQNNGPKRNIPQILFELSKLVKSYDKPVVSFETTTLNEYNRKRIIYHDVKYNSVKIQFYDVRSSIVQQAFLSCLRAINYDMSTSTSWNNIQYEYKQNDLHGLHINSNTPFFTSISFCEYFQDTLTVHTIINPKIKSISYGSNKMGDFDSNTVEVEFEYEGISNDIDTDKQILHKTNVIGSHFNDINTSQFLQLRWSQNRPNFKENINIDDDYNSLKQIINTENKKYKYEKLPKISHEYKVVMYKIKERSDKIRGEMFRDAWSIAKAYINKDVEFSWNTVKNQVLDTARKYGLAEEANLLAQAEHTIKTMDGKTWKDNIVYTINALGDPTTVVGNVSKTSSHIQSNLTSKLSSWF